MNYEFTFIFMDIDEHLRHSSAFGKQAKGHNHQETQRKAKRQAIMGRSHRQNGDMEKLCDMLEGVYAHEEHCIYHDGIIYLDDIIKCAEFIKEHAS